MPFDPARDIPDLSGKVALVTGGNVGIGASLVKGLAPHHAHIFVCARRRSSAEALVREIQTSQPDAQLTVLDLDLSSFASIRKCAETFLARSARLDLLFLNAGIAGTIPALTREGYEQQFGVNHVGHALLTQLLMPTLLATSESEPDAEVRVMWTSSVAGQRSAPKGGLVLADMKAAAPLSSGFQRYAHSKLANILFARKLAQQYPNITSTSFHPGVVKTEIWGKGTGIKLLVRLVAPFVWLTGLTPDQGALPGLWLATAKSGVENGRYYLPSYTAIDDKNSANQALADELWDWTTKELAEHQGPGWPTASS